MNNRLLGRFTLVALGVTALFATGCAATGTNLVSAGTVSSVEAQGDGAAFYDLKVLQAGNDLVVSGGIKQAQPFSRPPTGHVDVAVLDAQGKVLAKASHVVRYQSFVTKANRFPSTRPPHFKFSFPMAPTTGTRVQLALHDETRFSWSTVFDCGDNRAIAQVSRNS